MLKGGKLTQLQDDAPADAAAAPAAAGDVTFPDDYPNSVRGAQKKKRCRAGMRPFGARAWARQAGSPALGRSHQAVCSHVRHRQRQTDTYGRALTPVHQCKKIYACTRAEQA